MVEVGHKELKQVLRVPKVLKHMEHWEHKGQGQGQEQKEVVQKHMVHWELVQGKVQESMVFENRVEGQEKGDNLQGTGKENKQQLHQVGRQQELQ